MLSSLLSIVFVSLSPMVLIAMVFLIRRRNRNKDMYEEQFSTLTERLDIVGKNSPVGVYWNIITLARWTVIILVLILLKDNGGI
jgi:hypothetical protein